MRKVSLCFLRLHLCDVFQFRDDHARMRIRAPLAPLACLKFWQRDKLFWAFMSYLKAIFGNIRTNRKEILPYGWLTHWKWATMVAKIGLLQLTITWYKSAMMEGKLIIITALGHRNKGKSSFTGSGLFALMSQCGNNNELALQHGGFRTMW